MVADFVKLLSYGISVCSGVLLLVGCFMRKKNKAHQQSIIDISNELNKLEAKYAKQKKEA